MPGEIAPRPETPSEVIAMIKGELAARQIGSGAEIHIHYHAGSPAAPAPPAHTDAPRRTDKLIEYIVIMILAEIALGSLAVVAILLIPAIMSLATIMCTFMIGFAIAACAAAASIRSLRQTGTDAKIMAQRIDATRRTGRRR